MLGKPFAVTDEGVNVIEEGAIKDPAAVGLVRDDTERPVLACLDRVEQRGHSWEGLKCFWQRTARRKWAHDSHHRSRLHDSRYVAGRRRGLCDTAG